MLTIEVTSNKTTIKIQIPMTERKMLSLEEGNGAGANVLKMTEKLLQQIKEHNKI